MSEHKTTRPGMPECPGERAQFQHAVAHYGGPLRAIAAGLGTMSKAVPQGGSFAKILAIYSNEVAKAADAAGEPPVA